jgi:hypothetical protein
MYFEDADITISLTISAILCFATQPNRSLALLGFPRLTARSVGRHNPLSLAHILPPIQPHQPKRNLDKQSPTDNSPPSQPL